MVSQGTGTQQKNVSYLLIIHPSCCTGVCWTDGSRTDGDDAARARKASARARESERERQGLSSCAGDGDRGNVTAGRRRALKWRHTNILFPASLFLFRSLLQSPTSPTSLLQLFFSCSPISRLIDYSLILLFFLLVFFSRSFCRKFKPTHLRTKAISFVFLLWLWLLLLFLLFLF